MGQLATSYGAVACAGFGLALAACAIGAPPPQTTAFGLTDAFIEGDTESTDDAGDDGQSTTGAMADDGSSTRADDDHSTGEGPGDTGPPCPVGSEGCPCTMGNGCDPGLACVGGGCIEAPPECGNGLTEEGEECDDGDGNGDANSCTSDCSNAFCGDGLTGPGEACDDGNGNDRDECTNACALASCGDALVQTGEECDDGNADNTDACLNTCLAASCGDGVIWAGNEACDDGNPLNTDGCTNACTNAVCGDGIIWTGFETCDDSNMNPSDGCTAQCACAWDFENVSHIAGWTLTGGWALYTEAPLSTNPAVPFATYGTVFGTDGNRAPPYPGVGELETSSATTNDFVLPDTLEFLSWHVDEGGGFYDRKLIEVSVDGGSAWTPVLDCAAGIGVPQPFCEFNAGPRAEGDWDPASVDISSFVGQTGRVRFSYNTVDTCCTFEQGWFIDFASLLSCG